MISDGRRGFEMSGGTGYRCRNRTLLDLFFSPAAFCSPAPNSSLIAARTLSVLDRRALRCSTTAAVLAYSSLPGTGELDLIMRGLEALWGLSAVLAYSSLPGTGELDLIMRGLEALWGL